MTFKTTNRSKRLNAAGIRSICGTIDITVGTFCEAKQGTFHRV